jgi:uncharacterized repeat protein (TIGR03803 family)
MNLAPSVVGSALARWLSLFAVLFALCGNFASASVFITLHSFCEKHSDCRDGDSPSGTLVADARGNLFGTTEYGGSHQNDKCVNYGCGIVFELRRGVTPDNVVFKVLHTFCNGTKPCPDGSTPRGGMIIDALGNLYGTTQNGGKFDKGVFFKITPAGKFSVLHDFCAKENCTDGSLPFAASVALTYQGAATGAPYDGTSPLFGWADGGQHAGGVLYKLTPGKKWKYEILFDLCALQNCADGEYPNALTLDAAGNMYGTTFAGGGFFDAGTIFKFSQNSLQTLYTFCSEQNCPDGQYPREVTLDSSGNVFGIAMYGGGHGEGTLYKLTGNGTYSIVHDFCSVGNCSDGELPSGKVIVDSHGNIFGTAQGGQNGGIIYESNATFQVLYNFCPDSRSCSDGENPSPLIAYGKNAFAGTTREGGEGVAVQGHGGTIFQFTP